MTDVRSAFDAAGWVRTRFRALRSFHAARPTDIARYYRSGIEPLTRARWHDLVDECFLSQVSDPGLAAALLRARDVQFDMIRNGRVHFCCDERLLEERDGYTLLFGSLSLLAVAIRIDKEFGTDFKGALRHRGDPVVFVCDIPTAMIEDDALARLVTCLREADARMRESGRPSSPLGFHFSIPRALSREAIVAHYSPQRVIDTVYGRHIGIGEQESHLLRYGSRSCSDSQETGGSHDDRSHIVHLAQDKGADRQLADG
jgi:hypothetical protein